jgi:RNA polymerase sigma factor (sigma-70 family)
MNPLTRQHQVTAISADRTVDQIGILARDAASGDEHAWTELVNRLDGVLHKVAGSYRLSATDVDDVVQTTWLRAIDHIGQLNAPDTIASWLIVIARREAMRILQRGVREIVTDGFLELPADDVATPDGVVIRQELEELLRDAVGRLPERQQQLVISMLQSPTLSYKELSSQLGIPLGAIGPIRGRALVRLRRDRALQGLAAA